MQLPAYPGDGVYEAPHRCEPEAQEDKRTLDNRRGFEYVLN